MAKELVRVAAEAGADYVKFQTFSADKLVTKTAKQADYQKKNLQSGENDSQYNMLNKLELSKSAHEELIKTCEYYGIKFLSTAFDNDNLRYLIQELNLDYIKIPSGELTNYPYLRLSAQLKKPIILSTGMATLPEIIESVKVLEQFGAVKEDIYILHCTTEYPALISEVNLRSM
ncbi:MAG: N-acetylneuraminate synthase family protein, partial [Lentisphaeria bacterium]|nr:N-acetylneuraminate synthase family protein [Lentisphaeria bacterium]